MFLLMHSFHVLTQMRYITDSLHKDLSESVSAILFARQLCTAGFIDVFLHYYFSALHQSTLDILSMYLFDYKTQILLYECNICLAASMMLALRN